MTRVPARHEARSHGELVSELSIAARSRFLVTEGARPLWDPTALDSAASVDLGRGLLDSVSLALHVLWTYQQAWAEEGFLATARLPSSVGKLLAHVGYHG